MKKILSILLITGLFVAAPCWGTSTQKSAGAAAEGSGYASYSTWTGLSYIYSTDDSYAVSPFISYSMTRPLLASSFGFTIPTGATIDGIEVNIEANENNAAADVYAATVMLMKETDTPIGSNYWSASELPTSDSTRTYGSTTDKWGTSWTATEINASTFGVYLMYHGENIYQVDVDWIFVTVYYTAYAGWTGKAIGVTNPSKLIGIDKTGVTKFIGDY